MSSNESLSALRDLLLNSTPAPDPARWEALLSLMASWPTPEDLEVGLEYAATHLEAWPDTLRRASLEWWEPMLRGEEPHNLWRLARHLDVQDITLDLEEATALLSHPALGHIRELGLAHTSGAPQVPASCLAHLLTTGDSPETLRSLDLSGHNAQVWATRAPEDAAQARWRGLASLRLERFWSGDVAPTALMHPEIWAGLRELSLAHNSLGRAGVQRLAEVCQGLEVLCLRDCQLDAPSIEDLTASNLLDGVRVLDLSDNWLQPEGIRALAGCAALSGLRVLRLSRTGISSQSLRLLLESPFVENLRVLDLSGNQFRHHGAQVLAESARATRLETLQLAGCLLGGEGMTWLQQLRAPLVSLELAGNALSATDIDKLSLWESLAQVHTLGLAENRIGLRGVQALAQSPLLGKLTDLDLENCYIGTQGLKALVQAPFVPQLRSLHLVDNDLHSHALTHFAKEAALPDLRVLRLTVEHTSRQALSALAQAALPCLEVLQMIHCDLQPGDAAILARASWMQNLRALLLTHNELRDPGAEAFAQASQETPYLRLTRLDLCYNRLTAQGAQSLAEATGLRARVRRFWRTWDQGPEARHYNRHDNVWD